MAMGIVIFSYLMTKSLKVWERKNKENENRRQLREKLESRENREY